MKKKLILHEQRATKHISLRIPEDVLEDLKRTAPLKGMAGYQTLIKYYIGKGLRKDLRDLRETDNAERLDKVLSEYGLLPEQIREIVERYKSESEPAAG